MPTYWFVVSPENGDLYEALTTALAGKAGFHVIKERRAATSLPAGVDRRSARIWETEGFLIAEQRDPA